MLEFNGNPKLMVAKINDDVDYTIEKWMSNTYKAYFRVHETKIIKIDGVWIENDNYDKAIAFLKTRCQAHYKKFYNSLPKPEEL